MARKSSRALWTAHVRGQKTGRTSVRNQSEVVMGTGRRLSGIVLGIDPSLRGTGLAVVSFSGGEPLKLEYHSTVRLSATATMAECLGAIHTGVTHCLTHWDILHVAIEQTIYVQNFQTAQILGAARGAAIAAAAVLKRPVFEYAPLRMKQAVVGFGRASKEQVARTVMQRFAMQETLSLDEADAAGVALCHAMVYREPEK